MADVYDRPGRLPGEVSHEQASGPLDRADWPSVGDEVLYHLPTGGWVPAEVVAVAEHDGDLRLDIGDGPELHALDVKHGPHLHGWLLYRESVALLPGWCPHCGRPGVHTCTGARTTETSSSAAEGALEKFRLASTVDWPGPAVVRGEPIGWAAGYEGDTDSATQPSGGEVR